MSLCSLTLLEYSTYSATASQGSGTDITCSKFIKLVFGPVQVFNLKFFWRRGQQSINKFGYVDL